ncbi:ubiquitin-specific protease [Rhodotorula kratochvilovae]
MSSSPALVDCAVCDMKTSTRCSGCKGPAFCSTRCQAILWTTHKHFCKRPDGPATTFSFPPLTRKEAAIFDPAPQVPYVGDCVTGETEEWLSYVFHHGLWECPPGHRQHGAECYIRVQQEVILPAPSSRLQEPNRSYLLAVLQMLYFLVDRSTEQNCTPWSMAGIDVASFWQRASHGCAAVSRPLPPDLLTRVNPLLQQDLAFHTIGLHPTAEADRPGLRAIAVRRLRARAEELPQRDAVDKAIHKTAMEMVESCEKTATACVVM